MEKSIIIIGGGLTGLAAGCYGRMNGYKTTIYEMHDKAGGVCTAWKRKGYTIDGAMNWLIGTNPERNFYKIWKELGAAPGWKIYNHDRNHIYEEKDGKSFTVYCDADQFEDYLLGIAPEDKAVIKKLTKALRTFNMDMYVDKPAELYNIFDKLKMIKMLPLINFMRKWGKVTMKQYAQRFKNPHLRRFFSSAFGEDVPLMLLFMSLSFQHKKMAGYVIGGALALVRPIEQKYRNLGGEIHFNSRVEKIIVENDKAVGIRLADGSEHRADWVISAGDGRTAIFDMLDGRYIGENLKKKYDNPKLFTPLIYVALGVNRTFDDVPPSIEGLTFPLNNSINVTGKEIKTLNIRVYNFDPTLSPAGKNVAVVAFGSDYDYWKKLREDPEKYKSEKEQICNDVIAGLEERFPGITNQIEMRDVATPVTWERYTGNWRGSYEGWMFSKESFTGSMKKTLPGLENFYMAGQWVNPGGGMPTAAMSGRQTIQMISKKDKKKFAIINN